MSKQQTSVEWLIEQLKTKYDINIERLSVTDKSKAMEKQQTLDFTRNAVRKILDEDIQNPFNLEQYYNEQFNTTHNRLETIFGKIEKSEWQEAAEKRQLGRSTKTNWSD